MISNRTIAIIDDDKIFHVLTRKIIQQSQITENIIEFYDGQEALAYLDKNKQNADSLPDLIFLDIQMPYIDGWQFLDQYVTLKLPKPITIYIVSSSISSIDQEKRKQYNVVSDFIVKPFTRDKILKILNDWITQ